MNKRRYNHLIAQLATLEERLNNGWQMEGDKVDRYFVKLLTEYEAVYDELRAAGHV